VAFPSEEDFAFQRQVIRETYPRLFEAVEGQLRYVDEHLPDLLAAKPERTKFDLALIAHLARASKTALGIVRECEHGFGELAMSSLRILGETMVSAYWMSVDPEARADKFENWAKMEALDTLRFVQQMGWDEVEVPAELRDEEWVEGVRAEFPNPAQGWMQTPMKDVVAGIEGCWESEEGKKQFRQMLQVAHLFGDRHSHVGAFDTVKYLDATDEGQLAIHLGPSKRWVAQALIVTGWMYGQVFDLAAEHFGMPGIEGWRDLWKLLSARCKALRQEDVRGVGRNDPCPCGSGFKFKRCHLEVLS
jgi:hypothetical protein